jgi:RNA polymerase sigma factor FliA
MPTLKASTFATAPSEPIRHEADQDSDATIDVIASYRASRQTRERLDAMDMADVWTEYRAKATDEVRNYLVEKYHPLVRYNAERVYTRLPDEVDVEDLVSVGFFGLLDAIKNFKPDLNVKFETYCAQRIRGAILDELRAMDWVPRLVRHRTSRVEQVRSRHEMRFGRKPNEEEISNALGVDEEEVKKILKDGSAVQMSSLNRQRYQSDGSREVREIDVLEDGRQIDPLAEIQRRDLKTLLTKGLSRAERLIVVLYYYEQMTMKEIGATLDLSESRVSQMHSSILARLKAQLQHREREFEPVE